MLERECLLIARTFRHTYNCLSIPLALFCFFFTIPFILLLILSYFWVASFGLVGLGLVSPIIGSHLIFTPIIIFFWAADVIAALLPRRSIYRITHSKLFGIGSHKIINFNLLSIFRFNISI